MFELTKEEFENLMSKKSTLSWGVEEKCQKYLLSREYICLDNLAKLNENTYLDFCKEYPNITINLFRSGGVFHDRYIILDYDTSDEKIFLCGGSSKDAGSKITSILEDPDRKKYDSMIKELLQNPPLILK